jgi:hypothetical protein
MWAFLLLIVLAFPAHSLAQHVGDLSPNPNSNTLTGNPFNPGGSWSIRGGVNGRVTPTSPYTWSNVLTGPTPSPLPNPSNQFGGLNTLVPGTTGNGKGPYGISLPPNHPLSAGRITEQQAPPMEQYGRGGRIEQK